MRTGRAFVSLAGVSRSAMLAGVGVIFVLLSGAVAQAQTFSVIHNFSGGLDGATPYTGLTVDRAGNFYGTTYAGGSRHLGTVYRLKRAGSGWIAEGLYSFSGGPNDGLEPLSRVIFGPDGSLYGTASAGDSCGALGCGIVFQLRPPATFCRSVTCPWTESVLHFFAGPVENDGEYPSGELFFDQAGNLYGTTLLGGSFSGIVYELSRSGNSWTESIVHSFVSGGGYAPYGGLIADNAGNLYGTTQNGGVDFAGTVFKLTNSGSGWTYSLPYVFQHGNDGGYPNAGLIFDGAGNLFGATSASGAGGGGTVFELSPSGDSWTYTLLHSFNGSIGEYGCPDPGNQRYAVPGPSAALTMDAAGNLYGTTLCDGDNQLGSVFKLTPSAGGWTFTSLHDFTGGADGAYPLSNVTLDANGNLYGTASGGGSQGNGVVWEITP